MTLASCDWAWAHVSWTMTEMVSLIFFLPTMARKVGWRSITISAEGKFEDVTKQAGFDPNLRRQLRTAGDYDNDGAPI